VEFLFGDGFDASSIDILYCPQCSEMAPRSSLLVNLKEAFDLETGIWAIKFHPYVLERQNSTFEDKRDYYVDLWNKKKIIFRLLTGPKGKKFKWNIIGLKGETLDVRYSFEIEKTIEKDRRKKHKPKRIKKLN
jgi:hypothetical protein